ncbi:unnamed protein product [Phaedon cochleariae]|uniref:A-kinase anchor protein 7-like phosphoesterase domain-containing protein n=1 Tax=Phaedon cochleariae TaxID=80249 RepID=A0A9P0DD20_PHACE|nr:unnamed protein product [Phaedon cochleariae]
MLKAINGPCKPLRMWIDGRCFNLLKINGASAETKLRDDENESRSKEVQAEDNGKFSCSFKLPYIYCLALKQRDVLDTVNLSERTNTTIIIPKLGKDEKMVIRGDTKENVLEALEHMVNAVGQIRSRHAPLQFLSVRCSSEEIQSNFGRFKSEILADEKNIRGMEESIFQRDFKLHLTIDVLVLLDENEKNEAIAALKEYNELIMKPLLQKTGKLRIHLSGIECMNKNYEKVNVLYAKVKLVDETEDITLQKIANDLSHYFYERGLLKSFSADVKLHCTLVNTKYRKVSSSPKRKRVYKESIDARKIMEKYKDFDFGHCDFEQIHLSLMSSSDETSGDGYYKSLSSINLT